MITTTDLYIIGQAPDAWMRMTTTGGLISVTLHANEAVEWIWSGDKVIGYNIIRRDKPEHI